MATIGSGVLALQTANLFAVGGSGLAQGALKVGCDCGTPGCPGCGGGGGGVSAPSAPQTLGSPSDTQSPLANAAPQTIGALIGAQEASGNEEGEEGGFDPANPDGLSEEEEQQVQELKQRDQEVRRHEQAHAAVGGQYAGAPTYEYTVGPDGQRYAIGGEVSIDVSPVPDDPEATIQKMDQVIAAALAPAEPSGQDRAVASQAQATKSEAQAQLSEQRAEELSGEREPGEEPDNATGPDATQGASNDNGNTDTNTGSSGLSGGNTGDTPFGNPFQTASDLLQAAGGLTSQTRTGSSLNLFA